MQATGGHAGGEARHSSTGHRHAHGCWATALSGIPPRDELYNGTICRFPGAWGMPVFARAYDGEMVPLEVCGCGIACKLQPFPSPD